MSATLQWFVVALAVLASTASLARRWLPGWAWRVQARFAYALEAPGRPGWLRACGRAMRPAMSSGAGGCGSSASDCSSCGGCGSPRRR